MAMLNANSVRDALLAANKDPRVEGTEEDKLLHITALLALYEAMETVGWVEHTSDWDWVIDVQYEKNGTTVTQDDCYEFYLWDSVMDQAPRQRAGYIINGTGWPAKEREEGKPYPDSLKVTWLSTDDMDGEDGKASGGLLPEHTAVIPIKAITGITIYQS